MKRRLRSCYRTPCGHVFSVRSLLSLPHVQAARFFMCVPYTVFECCAYSALAQVCYYRDKQSINKFKLATVTAAGVNITEPFALETKWDFKVCTHSMGGCEKPLRCSSVRILLTVPRRIFICRPSLIRL